MGRNEVCYNSAMTYAIVSDIHANASAFRLVLADAAAAGAEQVICLGDVVGYGPLPAETLELVRQSAAVVLSGNHDDAVSGRQGADDFIDLAGDAVKRHREALSAEALAWLGALPYTCELDGACAAHGDFANPPAFSYVETEADAERNFAACGAQLMFVGHTHVPGIFLTGHSGAIYSVKPLDFTLEDGKRYLVNPGSVGYPREQDGTCLSSYVLYDSTARTVVFRFLPFSVSSVMQRGPNPRRRRGLVASAGLIAAAAIGAAVYFGTRAPVEKTTVVTVSQAEDPSLVLARRELALQPRHKAVRANLKLARGSDPVTLHAAFRSPTGELLGESVETVKSSAKAFRIPSGAVTAHFTVRRLRTGAEPKISVFSPAAE